MTTPAKPPAKKMTRNEQILAYLKSKTFGPDGVVGRKIVIYSNPGFGKTVLSVKLGKRNLIITDEDGYTSLYNHPELNDTWQAIVFESWAITSEILPLVESGEFTFKDTGEPFDHIIFDTVSGMVSQEVRQIVKEQVTTQEGKISSEVAGRPEYLVSEYRFAPVMQQIAQMRNCSVTMLAHLRTGDKLTPQEQTRADAHAAVFKLMNKYTSVIAHLKLVKGQRVLRVMPKGDGVSVKTRYHFPAAEMTDDEFVRHIEKWKGVS